MPAARATTKTKTRTRTAASRRIPERNDPRAWTPLAQASACALLALLAVFLVGAA